MDVIEHGWSALPAALSGRDEHKDGAACLSAGLFIVAYSAGLEWFGPP